MDTPNPICTPKCRWLSQQMDGWELGPKMAPSDLKYSIEQILQIRSEVYPNLSLLDKAGYDLLLSRAQRQINKSMRALAQRFLSHDPDAKDVGAHARNPNIPWSNPNDFSRVSWRVLKGWLSENSSPQQLYDFARSIRKEVLHEEMAAPGEGIFCEIYATIHALHSKVPSPVPEPVNPFNDWIDCVITRSFDHPYENEVFIKLMGVVDDLGMPTDKGAYALKTVANQLKFATVLRKEYIARLDFLLSCDVPFDQGFDNLYPLAQEVIRKHPAYLRKRLIDVAQVGSAPRQSSPPAKM